MKTQPTHNECDVEDAFLRAFSHESTQSDYDVWFNRITLAKSQGPTELLAEAKLFQKELFASSEYVARNRTQAEFVQDVYWTHLSREASAGEIAFWVGFMANPRLRFRQIGDVQECSMSSICYLSLTQQMAEAINTGLSRLTPSEVLAIPHQALDILGIER